MQPENRNIPLLSIVIPCYNHGQYLSTSIRSCINLGYPSLEIIVIDDGSTDETAAVAESFPQVRYFFKQNAGLPAARNTGFELSHGDYISFLDADDWYLPNALATNLQILINTPDAAFISGCHNIQKEDGSFFPHCYSHTDHFYRHLLHTNFIGNPSTVIYRRSTLNRFRFDTSPTVKGCEDYEHYLRITRELPMVHNPIAVSVYRKHDENMSNNYAMMLNSALNVMIRQRKLLTDDEEKLAWHEGWNKWVRFYGYFPVKSNNKLQLTKAHLGLIKKYNVQLPVMIWKKVLTMMEKKKKASETTTADRPPAQIPTA